MIDKPYCWLAIPSCAGMKKMVLVWRAKAMLAQEGKYIVGDDDDFLSSPTHYNPQQCELVILNSKDWSNKSHAQRLKKMAREKGISVRVVDVEQFETAPTPSVRVGVL